MEYVMLCWQLFSMRFPQMTTHIMIDVQREETAGVSSRSLWRKVNCRGPIMAWSGHQFQGRFASSCNPSMVALVMSHLCRCLGVKPKTAMKVHMRSYGGSAPTQTSVARCNWMLVLRWSVNVRVQCLLGKESKDTCEHCIVS